MTTAARPAIFPTSNTAILSNPSQPQLEDEVGWGMYAAIGVAICTVIVM